MRKTNANSLRRIGLRLFALGAGEKERVGPQGPTKETEDGVADQATTPPSAASRETAADTSPYTGEVLRAAEGVGP